MNNILEFMYLRKSDLDYFGIRVSDKDWDEIIINISWINLYTMDGLFLVMRECESYKDFIFKLVQTKGTFPDSNGITIQQKYGMYFIN
jgi:hypothetical protein